MRNIARVTLSEAATMQLKQVATKTGLSPNVVARFAMLISFRQGHPPVSDTGKGDLTINQSSLFGDLAPFLLSALALVAPKDLDDNQAQRLLAAHISRGAGYMNLRVKSILDLAKLSSVHDLP